MEQMIIRVGVMFLLLSNIGLLVVMIKITDKINLHHKLISEILNNLCDEEDDNEEE